MTSSSPYFCGTCRRRHPTSTVHTDFKLKLTLETLEAIIDYSVGVCQAGDNMAPLLFLFLMQAVMESLQLCWDDPDSDLTSRPNVFCYMPTVKLAKGQNGCLCLQPAPVKRLGLIFPYRFFPIFDSLDDLVAGASDFPAHFACFGLLMHAGTRQAGGTLEKLKTKSIYFPASPNFEPNVLPEPFNISSFIDRYIPSLA
jgi:hypothetical protein